MSIEKHATSKRDGASPAGGETILIVDDEPLVLQLCCSILASKGYQVLSAASAEEALRICEGERRQVDLLLSDIVMPRLMGTDLVKLVTKMRPEIRALFMSGYDGAQVPEYGTLSRSTQLIVKPFKPHDLLMAVRAALDTPVGL
jgi:two-component system cell cycle sensor histidine kinase/response regulator CckA